MGTVPNERFSADQALHDPGEDALGYAPFAEQLARSITKMAPTEGLVLAIYGAWGSGKTTVLNFVRYYLSNYPENQAPQF